MNEVYIIKRLGIFALIKRCSRIVILTFLAAFSNTVRAENVHLAVASNFTVPIQALKTEFQNLYGHKVTISTGSTGQLYNQILRGAPYAVFMAADVKRPALLAREGIGIPETQMTYALGRLALYTNETNLFADSETLQRNHITRLAIANPKTAPYGEAAMQVLSAVNALPDIEAKLVRGATIAQTYQFVETRNVAYALVAYAQVKDKPANRVWLIPESYHEPIAQDAILLKSALNNTAARDFMTFLKQPSTQEAIKKYGYDVKETPQ